MKSKGELLNQITNITLRIERKNPELYKFLDETPLTINSKTNGEISMDVFEDYLDSLKQMLKEYITSHKIK